MSENEMNIEKKPAEASESVHSEHHEGHSHHHGHYERKSHRHHRHRFKKRSSKKSARQSLLQNKKFLTNMGIILLLVLFLLLLGFAAAKQDAKRQDMDGESITPSIKATASEGTIAITVPFYDEPVYLVNEAALACTKANVDIPVREVLREYRIGEQRMDRGLPVKLNYHINGLPADCSVTGATVEVSENQTMVAPRVFSLEGGQREVKVYHLKTGTRYYYRITVNFSNDTATSVQGTFLTAQTPRILSIDGAVNIRDIGGWKTVDGKTVKQGMLFRGSELDGAVEPDFSISGAGLQDMLSVLNIRSDLDLRGAGENKYGVDALGAGVEHTYFHMPMYAGVFTEDGMTRVRQLFTYFADENTYPAYLHCTYGADRTGTVCYLLEALLGVSEADLQREYQLSALYYGDTSEAFTAFLEALDRYAGDTVQEKVENYLRSAGVTQEEMDAIRYLLTK